MARPVGSEAAAPTPATARSSTSMSAVGARVLSSVATVKTAKPNRNTRRNP